MSRWMFNFAQSLNMIKRHRLVSFILVIQCAVCFFLLGSVSSQIVNADNRIEDIRTNVTEKNYRHCHEWLDDVQYYHYMSAENIGYTELADYYTRMLSEPSFRFFSLMQQPGEVYGDIMPEVCWDGYEQGENAAREDENGRTFYYIKCIQVSLSFFSEFALETAEGRLFQSNDYSKFGEIVPVILGSSYSDSFSVGQTFDGLFLGQSCTYSVIGILKPDATYINWGEISFCDRYMIIPHFLPNAEPTNADKWMLIQEVGSGVIVSDQDDETIQQRVDEIVAESGANNVGYTIGSSENSDDLGRFNNMTAEVSRQSTIIFAILYIFIILSITITVSGFIREYQYEFGVLMLIGAGSRDISVTVMNFLGVYVVIGNVTSIFLMVLFNDLSYTILYIQIAAVLIFILSGIMPIIKVYHLDIHEFIGGKE